MTKHKGIIICRVSTSEQKQGTSLDTQLEWCEKKAKEMDIEIVKTIKEDMSGVTFPKEYFEKILQLVEDEKISHLFVYSIDRLSRSLPYGAILIEKLYEKNVTIITNTVTLDKTNANNKLQVWFVLLASELEYEGIHERTWRGIRRMLDEGKWPAPPPFGCYKVDSKLFLIKGYNKIIEFIFSSMMSRKCYAKTARDTNTKFENTLGKKLTGSDIKRIVTNKVYTGVLEWSGNVFSEKGRKNIDEQLKVIPQEIFEDVQKIVKNIESKHGGRNINSKYFIDLIKKYGPGDLIDAFGNLMIVCPDCRSVDLQKNGGDICNGGWVQNYKCSLCDCYFRFPTAKQLKKINSLNPLRCMKCGTSDYFNVENSQLLDFYKLTCKNCGYISLVEKKSNIFPNLSDSHM